ncbi:MAG: glycyl radical protein, partial [archaeon]|nr:glycyl radical protein [archaeon]
EQSLFLDSVIISCEAVKRFAQKFSDLANQMAEEETDLKRKEELLQIAKNMKKVPWEPPTSFHEAIQFAWFTLDVALISQGSAGIIAIGRPDQYLYPFYKNDIDNGNITEKIALELIEEFMIKTSYNLIPLAEFAKMTASELGADENAITVGGVAENGEDGANGLTYLFLDAIANIKNMTNSFSIRMSSQSSEEYLLKIADVYSKTSGSALFNDDIIVPSLMKNGYTIEEARDYGLIGCVEPASSGNSFSCTSGNDISLAGVLEMVLNNGKLRMMGKRTGLKTGKFEDFKSFEEILEAYKKQLFHTIEKISKHIDVKDKIYSREFHNPYISLTFEGCIENGTDMTQGGAKYSFGSIGGRGISTVADSLIAIKKAVFEDKIVTLKELKKALNSNFRGKEALRQKLINKYPKYGNDNDEVDDLIKWIADIFCDEVNTKKNIWGQCVRPGFFSFGMHVFDGSYLGATPNGRKAGMPVNNSMSPNNGCERNGPTAVIKSYSKINHEKISNGSSLNIRLLPSSIETDKGKKNLASILKAFIDLKGMHVQFNVVDNKILKEAQKHPDDYRDLVVRVSGYNAYFTDLGKPVQEDIIKRTQFSDY